MTDCIERDHIEIDGFGDWGEDTDVTADIAEMRAAEDPEFEAFTSEVCDELRIDLRGEPDEGVRPMNREEAERLMRRYRNTHRKLEDVSCVLRARVAELEEEITRLKARAEEVQKPYLRRLEWLDATVKPLLEEYARREIGDGKTRSVKLLDGTLKLRRKPLTVTPISEEAERMVIGWARDHLPEAVRETLAKKPLIDYVKATGEVPPGCQTNEGEDVFSLEVED